MSNLYHFLFRPFLLSMDAERAHWLTLRALSLLPPIFSPPIFDERLITQAFGLSFPNPLGMAAGFDKNAEVPDALLRLGFGFVEVGTVTPLPQPGNPSPRLFRLAEDEAIINFFGFNSQGHTRVKERLSRRRFPSGITGVNIGANKDSLDKMADYVAGIRAFASIADFVTINISSPNTPGLRDLQRALHLDELLARILDARHGAAALHGRSLPVLLKIAPDVSLDDLDAIIRIARTRAIDGMIISNTTISRPITLRSPMAYQTGGLSGKPLFDLSTYMLAATFLRVEKQFPLIGVGGISDTETALTKIRAGASLIQLYSAMVFHGPGLVGTILDGLIDHLDSHPGLRLPELTGSEAAELAQDDIPSRYR